MATPDHTARACASSHQDDHLASIPDSSHRANLTRRPRSTAPPALTTRLGDSHVVHGRQRGPLRATFGMPGRADHREREAEQHG